MTKADASKIIQAVIALGERLNEVDVQVRSIEDDEERKRLLRVLGSIISDLDAGPILPLVRRYPELDPDRARTD